MDVNVLQRYNPKGLRQPLLSRIYASAIASNISYHLSHHMIYWVAKQRHQGITVGLYLVNFLHFKLHNLHCSTCHYKIQIKMIVI